MRNSEQKKSRSSRQEEQNVFGQALSFAAKEAYKLLRTNLIFALPEINEGRGRIVGVTSSVSGEGKSTTTVNLASTLAEQGERVLVVEGDMRLPSLNKKIPINPRPGLSNILVSNTEPWPYIQTVEVGRIDEMVIAFDVLAAGDIPPNPSELIGSGRMQQRLNELASAYHWILLDLPPVTAVTDALVATKMVDGIIMVVRNEHADSGSLKEAMRQLKLVNAKILGFVYTCAGSGSGTYKKKYKYRYYSDYEKSK